MTYRFLFIFLLFFNTSAVLFALEPIKVIITGHTCAGKTSLIEELKNRGYYIVPEVATQVMYDEYQKLDRTHPENAPHTHPNQIENLQFKILDAQKNAYEKAVRDCQEIAPKDNLILFDRTEFDTYVYMHIFYPPDTFSAEELAKVNEIIDYALMPDHFAKDVIFCEIVPREYYDGKLSNVTRHESYDQSLFIGEKIRDAYQDFDFTLHSLGFSDTIEEKADAALELMLKSKR